MNIGERLRQKRLHWRLTQEELAEVLEVSPRTVNRWEQGLTLPRSQALRRLSHFFNREPEDFFEEDEKQTAPTVLWSVPFPRNPCFTGREEILHLLHTRLMAQLAGARQATALCGLGGIGKTQVAIEYAYRSVQEYQAIFWLAAETRESLMRSMQQIAKQVQYSEREGVEPTQIATVVQHWLATHSQWLLIADHVDDPDLLQSVLPSLRKGALLLTTRRQTVGILAEPLELPAMCNEEGSFLLLRRAKQLSVSTSDSNHLPPGTQPIASTTTKLVELLDGLPLALDQAGAYMEETGCNVVEYLQQYSQQRKMMLDRRGLNAGAHPESVTTTFSLSIQQIAKAHPAALDLLQVCAFLHPEAIPEELLLRGAPYLGPVLSPVLADAYQFDLLMAALRSASLVIRFPHTCTFSVYRLVQAVLVDQMEPAERRLWSERVLRMVNTAFPAEIFTVLTLKALSLVQSA